MTVVLPAPVASFKAMRSSSGFDCSFAPLRCSQNLAPARAHFWLKLGEPDGSFHGFDLAEKRPEALERMMAPVLQQPRCFRCDLPLIGVRQISPGFDVAPDLIDDRGWIVFLLARRQAVGTAENEFLLPLPLPTLPRLWNRRNEVGSTPRFHNFVGRLAVGIEFPMTSRKGVGRIQNWSLDGSCANPHTSAPNDE